MGRRRRAGERSRRFREPPWRLTPQHHRHEERQGHVPVQVEERLVDTGQIPGPHQAVLWGRREPVLDELAE